MDDFIIIGQTSISVWLIAPYFLCAVRLYVNLETNAMDTKALNCTYINDVWKEDNYSLSNMEISFTNTLSVEVMNPIWETIAKHSNTQHS